MYQNKPKLLTFLILVSLLVVLASPALAVKVIWQAPNVSVHLGRPFNNVEFEDPQAVGRWLMGYRIIDWRDADYMKPGHPTYDEWSVSNPPQIDGNINEIWMRTAGHSCWTNTTAPSTIVSVHLTGDRNDGMAEVLVDGVIKAVLDMGTWGNPQTALVIVKGLPLIGGGAPNGHKVTVNAIGIGPSGLGDDVAVLGACALGDQYKWFPRYWFLNCRLRLYPTPVDDIGAPVPVTIPHGWWGGWWWWHHQCCWLPPWRGPVWWWRTDHWPWWRYRLYWHYWPYYWHYKPWWYNWRWYGGRYFWGFKKCLHYYWRPIYPWVYPWRPYPILYWWGYYWDPVETGEGHCVNLVTQSSEQDPAGGRILPVAEELTDPANGLVVEEHNFSVNGGVVDGNFTPLEWVEVGYNGDNLRNHFAMVTGAGPNDVEDFMQSEIVQNLVANCQDNPMAKVGFEYAVWQHPQPDVEVGADSAYVTEGGEGYLYNVHRPVSVGIAEPVTVQVIPSSSQINIGAGPGAPIELIWEPGDEMPKEVYVEAVQDSQREGNEVVRIGHSVVNPMEPSAHGNGASVTITVQDDECGGLGIVDGDLNQDCKVNFKDFAIFAEDWLTCTDPAQSIQPN